MPDNPKKDILLVFCYGNLDDKRLPIERRGLYEEYLPQVLEVIKSLSSILSCYVVCGGYTRLDLPTRSEANDTAAYLSTSLPEYVKADVPALIQNTAQNTPQNLIFGILTAIRYLHPQTVIHIVCDQVRESTVARLTDNLQQDGLKFRLHALPRSDVENNQSEEDISARQLQNEQELMILRPVLSRALTSLKL